MGSVHLQVASSTQFNRLELSLGKNMKFFALLVVVGLAAASGLSGERGLRFESGKEFTFEYSGRLMTGFPALNSQYSGLGINATVSLIARTPTTLGMIVSQPKFVKINDVLEPTEDNVPSTYDGTNWRRVKLPQMMEVPEEFKRILSLPVVVQTIVNDGEFDFQLMGTKTERLVSGSLQTLKLKSVRPAGQMPQPSEPITLETMMYEYTEKAYGRPSVSSNSISEQILSEGRIPRSELTDGKVLAKAIPRTFFQGLNSETTPNKSEFVSEITKILKEVLLIIRGEENIEVNHEVNQMLLTAVRGMTALESVEEIERLYTTVLSGLSGEQTLTMKQLFLDIVVMTGTPHSIEFFERLVRQGKVPQSEITAFFMFLPRYVVLPTEQVLNRLFKLVTED